jgi:hypothetical protein
MQSACSSSNLDHLAGAQAGGSIMEGQGIANELKARAKSSCIFNECSEIKEEKLCPL